MARTGNATRGVAPHVMTDPKGIDVVVKAIQQKLSTEFSWLSKSFGRARFKHYLDKDEEEITVPDVFVADAKDPLNVLELDMFDSYSFMYANGDEDMIDGILGSSHQASRELNLIVWFDMKKLVPATTEDITSKVIEDILICLGSTSFGSCGENNIEVEQIYDQPEDVYADFTYSAYKTANFEYPFQAVRFQMTAYYDYVNSGYNI